MNDHYDDSDYEDDEQARLQNHLFEMQDMLKQLNEAQMSMNDASRSNWGRGRRGRGRRGGRGRGQRGFSRPMPFESRPHPREFVNRRGQNFPSPSRGRDQPPFPYNPSRNEFEIRPQSLVEILPSYSGFSCSLLQLLEDREIQPSVARNVARQYPETFLLQNEIVELRPQIKICAAHGGHRGCLDADACNDLHICNKYVMEYCREPNCILGHRWRTGHNDPVLKRFFIEHLPFPTLKILLQRTNSDHAENLDPLDLCWNYIQEGCNDRKCPSLHLCASFVIGFMKCKNSKCKLNHDLLNPSCHILLEKHGIATNETPRDVLTALLNSNPSITEKIKKFFKDQESKDSSRPPKTKGSPKKSPTKSKKKEKVSKEEEDTTSSSYESDSEDDQAVQETTKSSPKKRGKDQKPKQESTENVKSPKHTKSVTSPTPEAPKPVPRKTNWSHYLQGEVTIPEICYYSVESSCRNEGTGCQRLHATKHYHWQVEDNSRWLNLRSDQVECLEYAYCDPAKDTVDLPRLDPAKLEYSVSGLFIIMGRETWHSDFKTMSLTNASKSKTLKIRRLTTENIIGQEIKPRSNTWYFSDKNGEWVSYGEVDTAGASHLVSNITSDDIEREFLQNPQSSVPFKNSKFSYILDFKTMSQMNINTRVTRKVIRRPRPHLQEAKEEEEAKKATSDLPDTWEKMQLEERMRLVSLPPSSSEYKTVLGLLSGQLSSTNVMKVQRIQNPFLWRAFQNKVKEMTVLYKDASLVDVRHLFHGTSPNIVSNICAENFDWRLHGTKSGQSFGRGTYFATDPNYSYNYANPDNNNMRFMFIAQVAVGAKARGDSSMARPPINPQTSQPYDSTVNSVSNPSIIVKYDKQEYYPQYLLTLA